MDQLSKACDNCDLKINTKMIEVVYQIGHWKQLSEPVITVNG